jgi:hypothetical protein
MFGKNLKKNQSKHQIKLIAMVSTQNLLVYANFFVLFSFCPESLVGSNQTTRASTQSQSTNG